MHDRAHIEPRRQRARYRVCVRTRSGNSVGLRLAIGHDSSLNLIETTTPCEEEFVATEYTVLMSLTERNEQIEAELWGDAFGDFRMMGSFAGTSSGRFTHHRVAEYTLAGGGL